MTRLVRLLVGVWLVVGVVSPVWAQWQVPISLGQQESLKAWAPNIYVKADCTTVVAPALHARCFDTTRGVWNSYDGTGWQSDAALATNRIVVTDPRWGAKCNWNGTTGTDDTISIQAAFNAAGGGGHVVIPGNCKVTTVTWSAAGPGAVLEFTALGNLVGGATGAATAVLEITGRYSKIYNLTVNQNFNLNYTKGAIWWHSVDAAHPAQNNIVYGVTIQQATNGLVYGDLIGGAPVNAAQSENTIFGFNTRSVQVPFTGNQTNGFLTLVSPILDCNPNEWTSQLGYVAATWQAAAYAFRNDPSNHLLIVGGEILKTTSQLGYSMWGGSVVLDHLDAIEIDAPVYLMGDFTVSGLRGNMLYNNSAQDGFYVDPTANGRLRLIDTEWTRPAGVASFSGSKLVSVVSGTPTYSVEIINATLINWRWETAFGLMSGIGTQLLTHLQFITDDSSSFTGYVNYPGVNILSRVADNQGALISDTLSTASQAGWTFSHAFGGGSYGIQRNTTGLPSDTPASIQLVEVGQSSIQSATGQAGFVVSPSATYLVSGLAKVNTTVGGTNNMVGNVNYYDKTGALISSSSNIPMGGSTNFTEFVLPVFTPATAAFAALTITVVNGYTYNVTNLAITPVTARPTAAVSTQLAGVFDSLLVGMATGGNPGSGKINLATADGYLTNNVALKNISETLSNKTLSSPVLSGTVTGTYTLGTTLTVNAAVLMKASAGMSNAIAFGQNAGAATYGSLSLNNDHTDAGRVGLTGGDSVDTKLYVDGKTGVLLRVASTVILTAISGVQVGAPTGADKGAGTLNAAGAYYSNGTLGGGTVGTGTAITVRKGGGAADCTITFAGGLYVSTTC